MNGEPVLELCIQPAIRTAHLVTRHQGTHELETTIRYLSGLEVDLPHRSPFRPHRVGPFPIREIRITGQDVLVITDGGTVRLPPQMTTYSFKA